MIEKNCQILNETNKLSRGKKSYNICPREVDLCIANFNGSIEICNGSDPVGKKQICYCLARGDAMFIEQPQSNKFRFYCNDHIFDDDFNDLVFEMEIVK